MTKVSVFASLSLLLTGTAYAGEGAPGTEPCHLLCVNGAGRTGPNERLPAESSRFWVRLNTVGLAPLGLYTSTRYQSISRRGEAYAVQAIPSVTWRAREGLLVTATFPVEYNRSRGVVLPTLLYVGKSDQELAPGRFSMSMHARLPAEQETAVWLGLGGAVSDDIGTIDVKDDVATVPETGIEALGVGTDDLFATAIFAPRSSLHWEASVALEGRVHILDNRIYGTTSAYSLWLARSFAPTWSAGVRASGYRTILPITGVEQSVGLLVAPTAVHDVSETFRVSFGVASEVPGKAFNENSLQTVSVHTGIEVAF